MVSIFFAQLTRRYEDNVEIPDLSTGNREVQNEMVNYIIKNYRTITLKELADHYHFSTSYCSRLIRQYAGCPFIELLTRIRMQEAENLLLFTPMTATEISERLGYQNTETFIRAFQRVFHTTPTVYRQAHR